MTLTPLEHQFLRMALVPNESQDNECFKNHENRLSKKKKKKLKIDPQLLINFVGSRLVPVLIPSVRIQAPVLRAAVSRPLLKARLTLGGRMRFSEPPWTEISSLGRSICHSLSISWRTSSALESTDTRTYWRGKDQYTFIMVFVQHM